MQISLLRHYTWRRMVCAASTPASPGSGYAGPHLPGWWPTDGVTRLFDPMTVPVTRYRYRAANIPAPWQPTSTNRS